MLLAEPYGSRAPREHVMSEGVRDKMRQNEQERFTRLLSGAHEGDKEAFDCLCDAESRQRWLLAISSGLPPDLRSKVDPEDVLQDAVKQAWQDIGDFQGESRQRFRCWLSGVVRNRLLDAIRFHHQPKRDARRDGQASHPSRVAAMRDDHTPSKSVARRERLARITAVLDELPESYRAVVVLRYLEDFSTKEVAQMLGISANNVTTKLARALAKLGELCKQHGIRSSILRP